MGRAGKALREVLGEYGISQNKLSIKLGVQPTVVFRWFHEENDPSGEAIAQIVLALKQINPDAARSFNQRYLGDLLDDEIDQPES